MFVSSDCSSDVCSCVLKISALAKKKDSPSTSSERTVWGVWGIASRPELVEGLSLVCHPDTPSRAVDRVVVDVRREGIAVAFQYSLFGNLDRVYLPAAAPPVQASSLWERTCFEAFVKPEGAESYFEFNFDPARRWDI